MKKQSKKQAAPKKPQSVRDGVESTETVAAVSVAEPTRVLPSHERIQTRAYEIYRENGCMPGHEIEHWLQAERELMQKA